MTSPCTEAVRLYSVTSTAQLLEVSRDYVYDQIKSGALVVTELGSNRAKQRIRADVLQAFIDGRTFSVAPH
jgi:excisionase family DNA binding protein